MGNQKFKPQPTNIVIRTMKKDLEALRTSGGTISQFPPEEPSPHSISEEAFLYQNVPKPSQPSEPLPPTLESMDAPPQTPPAPPIPLTPQDTKRGMPGEPFSPRALFFLLGALVFFLVLGIIGYFFIYPKLKPSPEPGRSPVSLPSPQTPPPSPTPSPVNPVLSLREQFSSSTLSLFEKTSSSLLVALAQDAETLTASGTLRTLALLGPDTQYLTAKEFAELLLHNPPQSFLASLGSEYVPFVYYDKTSQARFGFAIRLIPETKESVETLMKNWETTTLDQDWAAMFLGRNPGKRKTAALKAVVAEGVSFREVAYQNNNAAFAYTVFNDILVVATNRDALLFLVKNLF